MASIDLLISAWDEAHREYSIGLQNLPDADVWRRPAPELLSVGEVTAHVAYYEAVMATGPASNQGEDVPDLPIKSLLVRRIFYSYPNQLANEVKLDMTAGELSAELNRIHQEARAAITSLNPDSGDQIRGRESVTWADYLQYLGFHVVYHAGQIYSVRHLLGHATPDN